MTRSIVQLYMTCDSVNLIEKLRCDTTCIRNQFTGSLNAVIDIMSVYTLLLNTLRDDY